MLVKKGNILEEVKQGIIIQQVNAQGVMGSGIAKQIRDKWPVVWEQYSQTFPAHPKDRGLSRMGQLLMVRVNEGLWVANIVGQQFYGKDSRRYTSYDALSDGLHALVSFMDISAYWLTDEQVHHPMIGCGLGGGKWPIVKAMIEHIVGPKTTLWEL